MIGLLPDKHGISDGIYCKGRTGEKMIFNKTLSQIVPLNLWSRIRREKIEHKHARIASRLKPLVEACDSYTNPLKTNDKNLKFGKPVLWQYWAQGFDDENMPGVLKICLSSVDKYAPEFQIIRLSDSNISDYIVLPEWIIRKKQSGIISPTHFSDILRFALLSTYGGLWLDCAVLLTGPIPGYITGGDFFLYRRDPSEPDKKFWESTFAYYFGWSKRHRVNSLIGILYAAKGNKTICDITKILSEFWRLDDAVPDYFFLQIIIDLYFDLFPERSCRVVNDCIPHLLRQILNGNPSKISNPKDVFKITTIHSLNYKNTLLGDKLSDVLKKILNDYNI